jgi:hypothetical protein
MARVAVPLARARTADIRLRAGIRVEIVTIAWMVVEAAVAIGAGVLARSVLLTAFGIDSVIELVSGGVLLWRLLVEAAGTTVERVERAENRAAWVVGSGLSLLCVYVVVMAALAIISRTKPVRRDWSRHRRRYRHARIGPHQTPDRDPDRQRRPARRCRLLDNVRLHGRDAPPGPAAQRALWLVVGG